MAWEIPSQTSRLPWRTPWFFEISYSKTAAPTSLDGMVAKNGGKCDDLAEFEICVDEEEALAELEDLLLSDEECFAEVDAESTERNEDNEGTEETMSCLKCGKVRIDPERKKISPQTGTSSASVGK